MGAVADSPSVYAIRHRDGIWWYDAPKPPRSHQHVAWTRATMPDGYDIYRCACGAMAWSDIPGWMDEKQPRVRNDEPMPLRQCLHSLLRKLLP